MANTYYLGTSDLSQFPKCGIDCFGGFITDLPCKGIEDVKCVCIEENKFALKVKEVDIKKCWEKNCDGRTFVAADFGQDLCEALVRHYGEPLNKTDPSPTATISPKPLVGIDDSDSSGLSTKAKIGIGAGVGGGLLALAFLIGGCFLLRRRRKSPHRKNVQEVPDEPVVPAMPTMPVAYSDQGTFDSAQNGAGVVAAKQTDYSNMVELPDVAAQTQPSPVGVYATHGTGYGTPEPPPMGAPVVSPLEKDPYGQTLGQSPMPAYEPTSPSNSYHTNKTVPAYSQDAATGPRTSMASTAYLGADSAATRPLSLQSQQQAQTQPQSQYTQQQYQPYQPASQQQAQRPDAVVAAPRPMSPASLGPSEMEHLVREHEDLEDRRRTLQELRQVQDRQAAVRDRIQSLASQQPAPGFGGG